MYGVLLWTLGTRAGAVPVPHLNFAPRRLLGTLLRRPLAHFLVHFLVHFLCCVTCYAAHDDAREYTVTSQMTCDTASDCAADAAFVDGEAWSECNPER
ncbi:MAG: hypothetical protein WAK55_27095 [Xanthobacteraceae bacterium]